MEFTFEKETSVKNKETVSFLRGLNTTLGPTIIEIGEETEEENGAPTMEELMDDLAITKEIKCYHKIYTTMVDGKVKLACTDKTTATTSCPLCGCKPSQMSGPLAEVSMLSSNVDEESVLLGLSPMHAYIKAMEFVLNEAKTACIGTKYHEKKTDEEKEAVKKAKRDIQVALASQLGIIVDCPKQFGSGNSNAGNTGRKFFSNPETVNSILGDRFSIEALERLHHVLLAVNSKDPIDPERLRVFCYETHTFLTERFKWGIPPSLHVLLMHSHQAASLLPLPLGFWSEEAQECVNKVMKKFRKCHVRTVHEEHSNRDLMMRLLNYSDPVLLLYSRMYMKEPERQELPAAVKDLLRQ